MDDTTKDQIKAQAEQLKNQAGQLTNQAVEALKKVDVEKTLKATDTFIASVFKFGKIISALFMFASLAVMVCSLVYCLFVGSSGLKVPEYDVNVQSSGNSKTNLKAVEEKNSVRKKYESDLMKVMKICKLESSYYDNLVDDVLNVDKKYRDAYVDGLVDYVEDMEKFLEKKGEKVENAEMNILIYSQGFASAVEKVAESQAEAKEKRKSALATCGVSLGVLIMFLVIPLLIQIEENTRAKA